MPDLFYTLFPDSDEIHTLEEIATRLHKNYDQAREAQHTLSQRTGTCTQVQPLDDKRPAHYSPAAARLIGRHMVRGEEREELRRQSDRHRDALLEAVLANQIATMALIEKLDIVLRVLVKTLHKNSPPNSG